MGPAARSCEASPQYPHGGRPAAKPFEDEAAFPSGEYRIGPISANVLRDVPGGLSGTSGLLSHLHPPAVMMSQKPFNPKELHRSQGAMIPGSPPPQYRDSNLSRAKMDSPICRNETSIRRHQS